MDGLKAIPDSIVSLLFTAPPYAVGIGYGNRDDNQKWVDYLHWLNGIWIECHRVLRVGGRLIINIDSIANHETDKSKEYFRPIFADLVNQMRKIEGMNYRGDIACCKDTVVGRT